MEHQHHDHHAMMIADLRNRFWVVLVLTLPVLLLSPMIQHWLKLSIHFAGDAYALAGLSSVIFFYGGWPFLTGWGDEMKARDPGMMTLCVQRDDRLWTKRDGFLLGTGDPDPHHVVRTLDRDAICGRRIEGVGAAGAADA